MLEFSQLPNVFKPTYLFTRFFEGNITCDTLDNATLNVCILQYIFFLENLT
jgi:hypothetical protein